MPDEWLNALCRRCKLPRLEHAPFAPPYEFAACESFMEATE